MENNCTPIFVQTQSKIEVIEIPKKFIELNYNGMVKFIERNFRIKKEHGLPYYSSRHSRNDLPKMYKELGWTTGVEVGTFKGDYAKIMCEGCPGLQLTCVDPWTAYHGHTQESEDKYYEEALKKLKPYNVHIMRQPSLVAVERFQDYSIDFVYIDGGHFFDDCIQDLIKWTKKVKHNGLVCVHDYDGYMVGVVEAVNAYTRCHDIRPWWVFKERNETAFWINP